MRRGFTLIELLVVIAIIGILSAVVLASLNTAREKGNDAAVQSNLSTIRSQAEIYFDGNGYHYGTNASTESNCAAADNMFSDPTIHSAIASADAANGPGSIVCNVSANGTAYAVSAELTATSNSWCIDSESVGKYEPSPLTSAETACP
ncbi:MAG TPA: type II secretion system protein [Candidatus Paceibacterota bacterium]|nr:type II secretion system protein [Candidatus Paceibacterota bacterium]